MERLELVKWGDVTVQQRNNGTDRIEMAQTLTADRSMWLAVRAYGGHQEPQFTTIAHSAPIYIVVDDEPTWKPDAVENLIAHQRTQLNQLPTVPIEPDGDLEAFETKETLLKEWSAQLPQLQPRIDEANGRYQALLDKFKATPRR